MVTLMAFSYFNSAMVRLTASETRKCCPQKISFQFRNGSINSTGADTPISFSNAFQFRNGSINSAFAAVIALVAGAFQFRNGSINSSEIAAYISALPTISIPQWFD